MDAVHRWYMNMEEIQTMKVVRGLELPHSVESRATGLRTGYKKNKKEKHIMKKISIYAVTITFIAVLTLSVVNTAKADPTGYPLDQKKWEAWWQDGRIANQSVKALPLDYPVDEVCWQTHAVGSPSRS